MPLLRRVFQKKGGDERQVFSSLKDERLNFGGSIQNVYGPLDVGLAEEVFEVSQVRIGADGILRSVRAQQNRSSRGREHRK